MKDAGGEILYVGKATSLRNRIRSYRSARPRKVGRNIIELLDEVDTISWELHPNELEAFRRENELIHALNPPYNIADNWEEEYFYIGFRADPRGRLEFQLRSAEDKPGPEGMQFFGCYRHRRRAKRGYLALLRLLFACGSRRARFSFPAKIARPTPAYHYTLPVATPEDWLPALRELLAGKNESFLACVIEGLLANETLPEFMRPALQDDIEIVRDFFKNCASLNHRELNERTPSAAALTRAITHQEMREQIRRSVK